MSCKPEKKVFEAFEPTCISPGTCDIRCQEYCNGFNAAVEASDAHYKPEIEKRDARIAELENYLVDEKARCNKHYNCWMEAQGKCEDLNDLLLTRDEHIKELKAELADAKANKEVL